MRSAMLVLSMSLVGCGAVSGVHDAGVMDAGLFPSGGGGGSAATGGGGGSDAGSGFAGDSCGNQVVVSLTASGGNYVGSAISDVSLATPSLTPTCGPQTKDLVFKVVAPVDGSLHVTVTPHGNMGAHFDPVISIYTGASCVAATSLACGDMGGIDAAETLIHQVSAGPVWVWVSGADPSDSGDEFDLYVLLD